MQKSELLRLMPRDKNDAIGAQAIVELGYPKVEPVLAQMLDWLCTNGSPVDVVMREFFAALGAPAMAVVRKALHSKSEILRATIVSHVLVRWPRDCIADLKAELQGMVTEAGFYGADLGALGLLAQHGLSERAWLEEWAEFKVNRLRRMLVEAENVQLLLKRDSGF